MLKTWSVNALGLQRYLHVTDDDKWISNRKKSWLDPGKPSISQPVRNIRGKICSVFGLIWELCITKSGETITGDWNRQQTEYWRKKLSECDQKYEKAIFNMTVLGFVLQNV